ncbi:transglycosylase SLT domain-containing protein [Teredinibacter turnerae]|uniref:transglycosylase SLT domain-containing protein n=1 Tax=Teredinibacter turnerae TaxID=2426 RepID=UPI0003734BCB|nr:transglycosylase SLT domain-containing protein [Teredinibacter turnerae]
MGRTVKFALFIFCSLVLAGCASAPPRHVDNICHIFDEKDGWYKDAKKATKKWQVPIATNMAIMYQESAFKNTAKPPRKRILGFIPGPRKSSAYGYAQAKDETWGWYKSKAPHWGADRNDFDDAIDFIAWYNNLSVKTLKIKPSDTYRLYLAYHEGHGGFARGTFNSKAWLKATAKKVSSRAARYQAQLNKCEDRLNSWWPF